MGMLIARRLAFMVFVLWGITLVTFFLSRVVPGDPARLLAGPQASPAEVAHIVNDAEAKVLVVVHEFFDLHEACEP